MNAWSEETDNQDFITFFATIQTRMHSIAKEKGFYDNPPTPLERIALIHSEISEAGEAFRKGHLPDEHCPRFLNKEIELADAVIRIMDFAEQQGFRLASAIIAKSDYNKTRPHKHGKTM